MKFLAQLQNPPREFTAIPFWFLNGELTAEELRRQLADFAAHGIYGVVLHPRMGLSPDITYLGGGRAAGAGGKRHAGRAQKRWHDARAALGRG